MPLDLALRALLSRQLKDEVDSKPDPSKSEPGLAPPIVDPLDLVPMGGMAKVASEAPQIARFSKVLKGIRPETAEKMLELDAKIAKSAPRPDMTRNIDEEILNKVKQEDPFNYEQFRKKSQINTDATLSDELSPEEAIEHSAYYKRKSANRPFGGFPEKTSTSSDELPSFLKNYKEDLDEIDLDRQKKLELLKRKMTG